MQPKTPTELAALLSDPEVIHLAMQRRIQRAVWEHKQLGNSIFVLRDGKVVWLTPDEIDTSNYEASVKPAERNGHS